MAKKRKTELDIDLDLKVEEIPETPVEEAKPPEEEKKKKPRFKFKLLPVLSASLILILIVIISGIIYYYRLPQEAPEPKKQAAEEPVSFTRIPQYQFEPFFLPVKTKNNKEVFLKIAFSLELSNELVIREIEQNSAILRANLSLLFNKKSLSDLKSDPDKKRLSQEIINILNRSFQKGTVKKVYFTQFFLK